MVVRDIVIEVDDAADRVEVEGYVETAETEVEFRIEVAIAVVLRAFVEETGGGCGFIGMVEVECNLAVNSVGGGEDSGSIEVVEKILVMAEVGSVDDALCELGIEEGLSVVKELMGN